MYELSLILGFGWTVLGITALIVLLHRRTPFFLAILISSAASTFIDFTGGSLVAMIFGPTVVMIASYAILRELLQYPISHRDDSSSQGPVLSDNTQPVAPSRAYLARVLLLRQHSPQSKLWLAHNGRSVIEVTPTHPERAQSGCRVGWFRTTNGTDMVDT